MKKPKKYKLISNEKEIKGNIWDFIGIADGLVIPINLCMRNEKNVMGAGLAKELLERFPDIDHSIYWVYDNFGTYVHIMCSFPDAYSFNWTRVLTFPTKPAWIRVKNSKLNVLPKYRNKVKPGTDIPGWMGYSDLGLIKKSSQQLRNFISTVNWQRVIMPKVGCGYGGLSWKDVKEILIEVGLYQMDAVTFVEKG
jgi:hypothetical protein